MSVRMTERDLEALRMGITAQVERDTRNAISQAEWEREARKEHRYRVKVIEAGDLREGDNICSTHGIRFAKVEETVVEVRRDGTTQDGQQSAGDLWVVTTSGGHAMDNDTMVLIEDKPEPPKVEIHMHAQLDPSFDRFRQNIEAAARGIA